MHLHVQTSELTGSVAGCEYNYILCFRHFLCVCGIPESDQTNCCSRVSAKCLLMDLEWRESAVRFVEQDEDSIRESAKASASSSANISGERREPLFPCMEKGLMCVCVCGGGLVDGALGCHDVRQGGLSRHAVEGRVIKCLPFSPSLLSPLMPCTLYRWVAWKFSTEEFRHLSIKDQHQRSPVY